MGFHCLGGQPVAAPPPGCGGGTLVRAPALAEYAGFFGDLRCAMPSEVAPGWPLNKGGCSG